MIFKDQFRFVRQNMKKNKTRLFMTVLATAMGCAFLIVLASVGFGLQQSVVDQIAGDRLVTSITVYGKDQNVHGAQELTDEDMAYLQSIPNVKTVTYRNALYQWPNPKIQGAAVDGNGVAQVDFASEESAGFALSAGRMPQNADEIVVGYHIREQAQTDESGGQTLEPPALPDAAEWLNETVHMEIAYYEDGEQRTAPIAATIVGIAEAPAREWLRDKHLYIDAGLLERIESITGTQFGAIPYFEVENPTKEQIEELMATMPKPGNERVYSNVEVIADGANHVSAIADTLREKSYYNYSIADELKQVNVLFLIMKIGLIFIGTIAVLIASIGIFNTMTMAVTERAGDIGIMKAIGAHPSVIRRIFLLESGMIGVLGAVIGTIVSYAISAAVNVGLPVLIEVLMDEKLPEHFVFSAIPPYLAVLSCAIALGVAMLSGYRPAKRATRIDVLRALRRDL